MGPDGLRYPWRPFRSVHHSTLTGRTVASCHVADAGVVTPDVIVHEVEIAGTVVRHPHEFRRERGLRRHPLDPLGVRIRGRHEAIGGPAVWQSGV